MRYDYYKNFDEGSGSRPIKLDLYDKTFESSVVKTNIKVKDLIIVTYEKLWKTV